MPSKVTRVALFIGLCGLYICIHLDRQMLGILAESVKSDLRLSDRQLGTLTGSAFSIVYALLGLHFGRLADHGDRLRLVIVGACVWSFSSIAGAFASVYGELIAARAGVAVGEAVATAAAVSLMAEVAGERHRARAAGIFFACAFAGAGAAAVLGGAVVEWFRHSATITGWRVAMMAAGAPGLLGAAYLGLLGWPKPPNNTARHRPPRSSVTAALLLVSGVAVLIQMRWPPGVSVPLSMTAAILTSAVWIGALRRLDGPAYRATLGKAAFRWLIVAFSAALFVDCAAEFWMIPYAQRRFGASAGRVGTEFGVLLILGGIAGCVAGGWIADYWRKRQPSGGVWIALMAILIETIAILIGLGQTGYSGLTAAFAVLSIAAGAWTAVAAAIGLDILPPDHRGIGTAAYFLITTLLGPGLGPFVVGLGSDQIGSLGKALAMSCVVMAIAAFSLIRLGQHLGARSQERSNQS